MMSLVCLLKRLLHGCLCWLLEWLLHGWGCWWWQIVWLLKRLLHCWGWWWQIVWLLNSCCWLWWWQVVLWLGGRKLMRQFPRLQWGDGWRQRGWRFVRICYRESTHC